MHRFGMADARAVQAMQFCRPTGRRPGERCRPAIHVDDGGPTAIGPVPCVKLSYRANAGAAIFLPRCSTNQSFAAPLAISKPGPT